jgi:hypothetical protein
VDEEALRWNASGCSGLVPLGMQFCHEKRFINSKGGIEGGFSTGNKKNKMHNSKKLYCSKFGFT